MAARLASAFATIEPDDKGFATKARAMVKAAMAGIEGQVDVGISKASVTKLRTQVKAALKGAGSDMDVKVSQASLAKMRADVKAAFTGATGKVDLSVSQASLVAMRTQVKEAMKGSGGALNLDVTKSSLAAIRAKVRAALDGITFSPEITAVSVAAARAKMKAGLTGLSVSINTTGLAPTLAKLAAINGAVNTQGGRVGGLSLIWGRWGRLSLTAIHWITTGIIELAAVLIPATAAAVAWAAVWLQGATNVATHINAVYTATEAMSNMSGVTAGQMVGLGNALQKAQDAANPDVYQALGAAIKIVNTQSGAFTKTGLAVGKVFDTFMAKLVYDFSSAGDAGKSLTHIFSNMLPDLIGVASFFGNLGHAAASAASQMPGLVEILLKILSTGAHFINLAVGLAGSLSVFHVSLITAVIAAEEFFRWGGLLVSLMNKMGITAVAMGPKFLSFQRFGAVIKGLGTAVPLAFAKIIGGLGGLGTKLGGIFPAAGRAGQAMEGFAGKMSGVLKAVPAWQVAIGVVAAVAVGYLIYKLVSAKSAAQNFADSLQVTVNKANNLQVLTVIGNSLGQLADKMNQARLGAAGMSKAVASTAIALERNNQGTNMATQAIHTYTAAQKSLIGQSVNVLSNSARLAAMYHTSIPGAMALADMAGVKLTKNIFGQGQAAFIARTQVANLVQGYASMGRPLSVVGNDMVAVSIQAGLQQSLIAQVTAAWTAFMTTLTGGTNGLAGFQTSLKNMLTGVATFKHNLGKGGGLTDTISQFASDLTNSGKKGSQAWQNFDQVVGQTAPDLINWLSQAGTMGVLSGAKFVRAAKDMIAQLLPFAARSKTARAELSGLVQMAGGPAISSMRDLTRWVGNVKNPAKDLSGIIGQTTIKMSQMSKVAQNLGTVLQTELVNMMDKARLSASGVQGKMVAYTRDLEANTAKTTDGQRARTALISALVKSGLTATAAEGYIKALTASVQGNQSANEKWVKQIEGKFLPDLMRLHADTPKVRDDVDKFTKSVLTSGNTSDATRSARQKLIKDLENSGVQAKTARDLVDKMQGAIDKMHGKTVDVKVNTPHHFIFAEKSGGVNNPIGELNVKQSAKGSRVPGYGGGDKHLYLLEGGEAVVSKEATKRHARTLKAMGVPGMQSGGVAGLDSMPGMVAGALKRDAGAALAANVKAALRADIKAAVAADRAAQGGGGAIVKDALRWLGRIPYVWGGTAVPGGADCSGFTQTIYSRHGISAPRTSEDQYHWAKRSGPVPGGLAFYVSADGGPPPGHVAIVRNAQQVISQGGGMGPQLMAMHAMPLMGTGIPPRGFPGGSGPGGGRRSLGQLEALWEGAGGRGGNTAHIAAAIALAESGGNANARNPSGASGLWQILGLPFPGNPFNPATNAAMAVTKWREAGFSFGPWVTYVDGAYERFMSKGGKIKSFDKGGWLPKGLSLALNTTGHPERVIPGGGGAHVPAQPVQVQLSFSGGPVGPVERALWTWLQESVRVKGGGNAQKALGRH